MKLLFISTIVATALTITTPLPTHAIEPCIDHSAGIDGPPYSTDIALSEVYPAPDSDQEEFIELVNTGDAAVNLLGWSVSDASGKAYTISEDDLVSTTISADDYLVLPQSVTKIYLNNSDDIVQLHQPDGTLLDSTNYSASKTGWSWSLIANKGQTEWQWTLQPTEGKENSLQLPESESSIVEDVGSIDRDRIETSNDIRISELLPNPEGVDSISEWIELENIGEHTVYLGGWQLTDETTYYKIGDISIHPGEYLVFESADTDMSLNNSGERIFLIDPFDDVLHGVEYPSASSREGESWASVNDEWAWSNEPTPGEENRAGRIEDIDPADEDIEDGDDEGAEDSEDLVSIAAFRGMENESTASIEGIVTVLPDIFGSQYFYVQDAESGIQVYSYHKYFPEELSIGDRIRVRGEKSESREETRIKISAPEDIVILDTGQPVEPISIETIEEIHEGLLVQATGEITEKSSTDAMIDDIIAVQFKSGAAIDSSELEEGVEAAIIGVAIQSNEDYRLLPRSTQDISVQESSGDDGIIAAAHAAENQAQQPMQESRQDYSFLLFAAMIGVIIGMNYIQHYLKKRQLSPAAMLQQLSTNAMKKKGAAATASGAQKYSEGRNDSAAARPRQQGRLFARAEQCPDGAHAPADATTNGRRQDP